MRLLIIRTSAMGDVALTVPVLKEIRKQYPDVELIMVTRPEYEPFFSSIEKLELIFPDLDNRHKGLSGVFRLFRDITRQKKIDHIIDLHDVLRSKFFNLLCRLSGIPVSVIDKGRLEKRAVITGRKKVKLKHTVDRYSEVFAKAGFPVTPQNGRNIKPSYEHLLKAVAMTEPGQGELNIGVAPYAKHKLKVWPEENMIRLLEMISSKQKSRFWLFGGKEEADKISAFQHRLPETVNIAGKLMLDEELALMSKLDFMIAMDSSNMHMAALAGTKVVSIWGGTDPLSGFGAWKQPEEFSIRIPVEDLTCRPCTTFGKGECKRGDFACMHWLTPEIVFRKIERLDLW